jgi:ABC-2 type transport system permease protein
MLFIGGAAGADHSEGTPAPIWFAAEFGLMPGQFGFLLIVVLAVTSEFSTGMVRSSLQWTPRRGVLLAARLLVPVAFATVCSVIVAAAADLVAWGFIGAGAEVVPADIARSLATIALVVAVGAVLAAGFGLLLRSTAGTLTTIFLLMLVLPLILVAPEVPWLAKIGTHLPGFANMSLLSATDVDLAVRTAVIVLISWTTAAMVAGGWALLRRDTR